MRTEHAVKLQVGNAALTFVHPFDRSVRDRGQGARSQWRFSASIRGPDSTRSSCRSAAVVLGLRAFAAYV